MRVTCQSTCLDCFCCTLVLTHEGTRIGQGQRARRPSLSSRTGCENVVHSVYITLNLLHFWVPYLRSLFPCLPCLPCLACLQLGRQQRPFWHPALLFLLSYSAHGHVSELCEMCCASASKHVSFCCTVLHHMEHTIFYCCLSSLAYSQAWVQPIG